MQYIVILEPFGEKPPSTYYARLQRVLEDNIYYKLATETNRTNDRLYTPQEGVFITNDESLAHLIANIARETGNIEHIKIGRIDHLHPFQPSPETLANWQRVERVLSARGRKPDEQEYTVTCLAELTSRLVLSARAPAQCPVCGSPNMRARLGQPASAPPYSGNSLLDYWLASRFAGKHLEFPATDERAKLGKPVDSQAKDTATGILANSRLLAEVEKLLGQGVLTGDTAITILDNAVVSRLTASVDTRRAQRAQAFLDACLIQGNQQEYVWITELPTLDWGDVGADQALLKSVLGAL